ncbi:GTP-binding protein [Tenacibaculum sp. 190130A14a]|uniref:GTP-binding protein n=1 Tax=Tenacibaculum polynesiense TaxID=3137857 RepID=A0ABM9P9T0_9FLAO
MNKPLNYVCPKCNNTSYEVGEMRATGGTLSKIFDVQNKKFTSVTCKRCSYTEFYKASTSALSNIFDFFTN